MQNELNTYLSHTRIQKLMLKKTATWNDMKFQRSRIVCNAECASDTKDQRDFFCGCGRMLQDITEEVKKQEEQRTSSRFIMYVLGIHDLAQEQTQRGRRHGTSAESRKLKNSQRLHRFRAETQMRNYRGALLRGHE